MLISIDSRNKTEKYDSLLSFVREIEHPSREHSGVGNSSTTSDEEFAGVPYSEAIRKIREGDTETANKIRKSQSESRDAVNTIDQLRWEQVDDVWGDVPNIPNYLAGVPEAMIRYEQTAPASKIVNVMINFSVSARVEARDIERTAEKYTSAIYALEKQGYRCEVSICIGVKKKTDRQDCRTLFIKVKRADEYMNLDTVAFALGSVSMFRRLGFRWIEYLDVNVGLGYGTPVNDVELLLRHAEKAGLDTRKLTILNIQDKPGKLTDIVASLKNI